MTHRFETAGNELRLLSDDELTKVGGGVVTTGPDIFVDGPSFPDLSGGDGGSKGSDDGGYTMDDRPNPGTGGSSTGEIDPAKDTPCVTASPSGYALSDINNSAKAMARAIAAENDGAWEYGGIIYGFNGTIGMTRVVTQQMEDRVRYPIEDVPDGAVILALVHNQPNQPTEDDSYPSPDDWETYSNITDSDATLPCGITADSNMLMYVYTDEDYKTRVYDKNDKDTTNEQCAL